MKKITNVLLALVLTFALLTGCGGAAAPAVSSGAPASATGEKSVKVGLLQLAQHPSLDEIAAAIEAELQAKASENGMALTIDFQNANNDLSTIDTICRQFVADKVDVIIAIATPAAQGAATAVEGTEIPVVFSAVTDPVAAELVDSFDAPGGNITGTSDAIAVDKIFALASELTPDAKSFGLIYNTSEVNSASVIADAKAYLDGKKISYVESAVTTPGDVQMAAQNLLSQCDAIFAPIDNTVAQAMTVLAEEAIKAKKPVYVAADSMVHDGGLATVGVNYTALGTQTADMAMRILQGAKASETPVEVLSDNAVVVNAETADAIGVNVDKYKTEGAA
ncbi:MAG: ABC transporter substrate-binding protein [Ruthenibacterium sp.]